MIRVALCLALAVCPTAAFAETVSGAATVIDGDTITIGNRTIRLFGIDAPEDRQSCVRDGMAWACGEAASDELRGLVRDAVVECQGDENDEYGRLLAVCQANGFELNRTLVEYGWAVAFRRYSQAYVAYENRAKSERLGIWSSEFDQPEDFRFAQSPQREARPARQARPAEQQYSRNGLCTIKGNRNRRGQWIYHLPGMPYYDDTRPEELFCTEADAQAAGYRRAIVR